MNINKEKYRIEYNEQQKTLINLFKFYKEEIELKGSSSKSAIKYYADYDFFSKIRRNYGIKEIYDEFHKILNNILSNPNTYFIEFKLQKEDGEKIKWFYNDNFTFKDFSQEFENVDFCKIDIILFSNNIITEASCIYSFSKNVQNTDEIIKMINNDIKDLKKENNYFKILKRLYLIKTLKNDTITTEKLIKIFNSDLGLLYKKISNIDAIDLLKKYYNDPFTKKKIETNLKDINYPLNYKEQYNKDKKILNQNSKIIYKELI